MAIQIATPRVTRSSPISLVITIIRALPLERAKPYHLVFPPPLFFFFHSIQSSFNYPNIIYYFDLDACPVETVNRAFLGVPMRRF